MDNIDKEIQYEKTVQLEQLANKLHVEYQDYLQVVSHQVTDKDKMIEFQTALLGRIFKKLEKAGVPVF